MNLDGITSRVYHGGMYKLFALVYEFMLCPFDYITCVPLLALF